MTDKTPDPGGFSEEALRGLYDFERHLPPPAADRERVREAERLVTAALGPAAAQDYLRALRKR